MKLLVSALETSSNIHLKEVLKHLPDAEILGIFDKSYGSPLYDVSNNAIMGFIDVVKRIKWYKKLLDDMVELAKDADKILLMDSSAFNLPLAKRLKKNYPNKELIYYILPQVWASRPNRTKKLELYCDRLLGILPFEVEHYIFKAEYIGHPLLDEIKKRNSNRKGSISFLAGSRKGEIKKLLPIFRKVRRKLPRKKAFLVIPKTFSDEQIKSIYGDTSEFEISRDTQDALSKSEFAFICSGTATLESALIGTPFVLCYITKKVDLFIGKKILNLNKIGLPNILLEKYNKSSLHKELIQRDVTVDNLLEEYYSADRELFTKKAKELRAYLKHGSSENVARIISQCEIVK